jgi:ABC-type multidrug transport system ATPase subunit
VAGTPAVLRAEGLALQFDGAPRPLWTGLSFRLGPGTHALEGESGSGKTCLLRGLAGVQPLPGRLWLNAQPLADGPAARQALVWWADAQDPGFDALTPAAAMQALQQRHGPVDATAWQRHVDAFGLAPHAFKTLHMLSTGMRRKAVLAAALASACPLLLLDEPCGGLDAPAIAWLAQALNARAALPGCTTLMVSGRWPDGLAQAGRVQLPPA